MTNIFLLPRLAPLLLAVCCSFSGAADIVTTHPTKTGVPAILRGASASPPSGKNAAAAPPAAPAAAAAVSASAMQAAKADPAIKGYAVPIGGALKFDNEEVWGRIVALAGGKGARFVVFGTASDDPEASARQAVDLLQRRGAVAEALPVAPRFSWVDLNKVVRDPALIAKVKNARGVFFTGGSQERIVDVLMPGGHATPMLEAIWDVYRRGGVVAGTSAGAAIMSTVMFRDAPSVINIMKGKWVEGKQIDRGLGFVGPDLFVDQHFLKRGRFGRMIPLMMAKGYKYGLGVDENSAAVIHGDEVEVIGGKGAMLVDLSDTKTDPGLGAFNVSHARLTYLDHGDRYNLKTHVTTPSAVKLRGEKLDPSVHATGQTLRQQALTLFAAPTIDAAAIEALRVQMQAQHEQVSKRMSQAMVDSARVLTPEQRAKFAERMKKRQARMAEPLKNPAKP